ncbi:MAG: Gfo/Idh/MocA family oxidoreductase [Acidimicrobiales bacterium]
MTDTESSNPTPLRWGVIGATSKVAQRAVLPALAASPSATVVAVASRSHPGGDGYDTFGATRTHGTYHDLLADPEVEAVYVPLPNALHAEWTVRAAEAGKHVLCEKPLATAAAEAREMVEACDDHGVRLMEAYMTPFHPRHIRLEEILHSRRLGVLRFARASFTGVLEDADDHRWRPENGGGALLDVGVYCLAPLLQAAGRQPVEVASAGMLSLTGVDISFHGFLDFGKAFSATFECSFEAPERQQLEIVGKNGAVLLDRAFTPGLDDTVIRLQGRDGVVEEIRSEGGDPYLAMVEHFAAVIRDEIPMRRPPARSLELLDLIDRLKKTARWEW